MVPKPCFLEGSRLADLRGQQVPLHFADPAHPRCAQRARCASLLSQRRSIWRHSNLTFGTVFYRETPHFQKKFPLRGCQKLGGDPPDPPPPFYLFLVTIPPDTSIFRTLRFGPIYEWDPLRKFQGTWRLIRDFLSHFPQLSGFLMKTVALTHVTRNKV